MLGTLADALPEGPDWVFEPKWDGFRVLAFRDGDALELRSRDGKPLLRYFPELDGPLRAALPEAAVADGEIVVARGGALDFEAMQLRLHPAASRIRKLSAELPAAVVLWDLLASGAEDLRARPFAERRERLAADVRENPTVRRTPSTADRARAEDWFARFAGAGLDGVMAKRLSDPYQPGKRALVKVKHVRTIDCVVLGFRWHKGAEGSEVGSLVLGLHAPEPPPWAPDGGTLWPIGVASSFAKAERRRLAAELAPLAVPSPWEGGEQYKSRWSAERDLAVVAIPPERVVEVSTTQHSDRRLRHPAKVVRWRTDKRPSDCGVDQLAVVPAPELGELFR